MYPESLKGRCMDGFKHITKVYTSSLEKKSLSKKRVAKLNRGVLW